MNWGLIAIESLKFGAMVSVVTMLVFIVRHLDRIATALEAAQ